MTCTTRHIEDVHRAHQRTKIELYGDSIFVVLRTAHMNQEHHSEFGETHFFVGMNFIEDKIFKGKPTLRRHLRDAERAWHRSAKYWHMNLSKMLFGVMDNSFLPQSQIK